MIGVWKFILGGVILTLGIPLGNYLAHHTKEELKAGQIWFKLISFVGLAGAILSLIFQSDILLFSFLFIVVVTSRCLR